MLDLGFLPDVEKLLSMTPETRQTMLFSATMPGAIVALARTHMRHPMNIRAEHSTDSAMVPATAQFIYQAHDLDKPEIIARILQADDADKIIVFTRTKRQAQRVAEDLAERGFSASPLHGDMAQVARERALTKFRDGKLRGAGRHRRRRPWHRRPGRLARHQLHLPRGREDLHPPDRPHRPRRRHRHRRDVRGLGRPPPLEDDQQGAGPAVRRAAGDLLHVASTSTTTSASPPAPRAASSIPRPRPSAPIAPATGGRASGPAGSAPSAAGAVSAPGRAAARPWPRRSRTHRPGPRQAPAGQRAEGQSRSRNRRRRRPSSGRSAAAA